MSGMIRVLPQSTEENVFTFKLGDLTPIYHDNQSKDPDILPASFRRGKPKQVKVSTCNKARNLEIENRLLFHELSCKKSNGVVNNLS